MTVETRFEVFGLKQALAELNSTDKTMRRQITKDFKALTNDLVSDIQGHIPQKRPISGWSRAWVSKRTGFKLLPWEGRLAMNMVKQKVSGKKPREFNGIIRNLAVFSINWQGMTNTIYDMAGRKNSSPMSQALDSKVGKASRVMYPAFDRHEQEIQQGMLDIIEEVGKAVNRRLNVVPL